MIENTESAGTQPADNERKCRICGCTQNDCRQCIEKTGEPCHWVADDLCSACAEPAEAPEEADSAEGAEQLVATEVETVNSQPIGEAIQDPSADDQTALPPAPTEPIEEAPIELPDGFFQGLAALGHVDVTIRAMQKGEKITVSVLPNNGSKGMVMPIIATGTPSELDEGLLKQFGSALRRKMIEASQQLAAAANEVENKKPAAPAPNASNTPKKRATGSKPSAKNDAKATGSKKPAAKNPVKEKPAPKAKAEPKPPAPPKPEPRVTAPTLF